MKRRAINEIEESTSKRMSISTTSVEDPEFESSSDTSLIKLETLVHSNHSKLLIRFNSLTKDVNQLQTKVSKEFDKFISLEKQVKKLQEEKNELVKEEVKACVEGMMEEMKMELLIQQEISIKSTFKEMIEPDREKIKARLDALESKTGKSNGSKEIEMDFSSPINEDDLDPPHQETIESNEFQTQTLESQQKLEVRVTELESTLRNKGSWLLTEMRAKELKKKLDDNHQLLVNSLEKGLNNVISKEVLEKGMKELKEEINETIKESTKKLSEKFQSISKGHSEQINLNTIKLKEKIESTIKSFDEKLKGISSKELFEKELKGLERKIDETALNLETKISASTEVDKKLESTKISIFDAVTQRLSTFTNKTSSEKEQLVGSSSKESFEKELKEVKEALEKKIDESSLNFEAKISATVSRYDLDASTEVDKKLEITKTCIFDAVTNRLSTLITPTSLGKELKSMKEEMNKSTVESTKNVIVRIDKSIVDNMTIVHGNVNKQVIQVLKLRDETLSKDFERMNFRIEILEKFCNSQSNWNESYKNITTQLEKKMEIIGRNSIGARITNLDQNISLELSTIKQSHQTQRQDVDKIKNSIASNTLDFFKFDKRISSIEGAIGKIERHLFQLDPCLRSIDKDFRLLQKEFNSTRSTSQGVGGGEVGILDRNVPTPPIESVLILNQENLKTLHTTLYPSFSRLDSRVRSLESNNKTTLATLKTHQSLLEVIEKATMELSSTLLTFSSNRNWHGNSEAEES